MINIAIILVAVLLLFAWWNGEIILWKFGEVNSERWHQISFLIRGLLGVAILLMYGVWEFLGFSLLAWLGYNGIINKIMGEDFMYFGQTAKTDRFMRKVMNKLYRGMLIYWKDDNKHWSMFKGSLTIFISIVLLGVAIIFLDKNQYGIDSNNFWKIDALGYIIFSFFFVNPMKYADNTEA